MRLDNLITPTRVELASRCYRRHVLTDIMEKGLYKSAAASFGNVIHAGVAEYWRSLDISLMLKAVTDEYTKYQNDMNDKHSLPLALSMMEQYAEKAVKAGVYNDIYQTVMIEERMEYKIDGLKFSFQLDRLLSWENTQLVLVDAKTASRLDARWRSQWPLSLQMRLYKRAIEDMFDMPVDIVIEGLEKKLPLKIEYYPCPDWDKDQLDEAVEQAKRIYAKDEALLSVYFNNGEDEFIEAALRSEFNYGDCHAYNFDCPFLPLCGASPSHRKGMLMDYIDVVGEY